MRKKLSWKKEHKEELKQYYLKISIFYKSIHSKEFEDIILSREYTDHLYKMNLYKQELGAHLHHIIPRACGGTDNPINLIWLTKDEHANAHAILYRCNKSNVSIRCAATMLRVWANKRKYLTAGEHRKNAGSFENSQALYGESSYSWQSD
jgi:hypothetical protein